MGVFNQIYAIYVISGQVFVFGLNDSAQKHVAEYTSNPSEQYTLSIASLILVSLIGFSGALLLAISSGMIGKVAESKNVGTGVLLIAPGLFFFTINKVIVGILNGQRRMVAFAIVPSVRAIGILLICVIIAIRRGKPYELGLAFTGAEIFLLAFTLMLVRPLNFGHIQLLDFRQWLSRHLSFGSKALVNGFLAETFFRVDIIMLGIFLADREVGIYSFAAMFVEGIYQVPVVIRNITNPILVRLLINNDRTSMISYTRKVAVLSFLATLLISAIVIFIYPYLPKISLPRTVIDASYLVLLILLAGLTIYSIFIPFDYIFNDAGRPGTQSIYMTINTSINVILNLTLIPIFGIYGASTATAVSFACSWLILNILVILSLKLDG